MSHPNASLRSDCVSPELPPSPEVPVFRSRLSLSLASSTSLALPRLSTALNADDGAGVNDPTTRNAPRPDPEPTLG